MTEQRKRKRSIKKQERDYVDSEKFLRELIKHREDVLKADEAGEERPPVNNFLAETYFNIAKNYAKTPNFSGYPFKDEMIMDAVENSLKYGWNFDHTKGNSPNPFAYFTTISHYAFTRRINKEKKYLYTKYKLMQKSAMNNEYGDDEHSIDSDLSNDYINDFIRDYERRESEKKEKLRQKRLENSENEEDNSERDE